MGWNAKICLLIIVLLQVAVAFFGHNLVQTFERSTRARCLSWRSASSSRWPCGGPSSRSCSGVAGFFLALTGLHDAGARYNNFLLVIACWIGPWLGVFFTDQVLRHGKRVDGLLFDRKHRPWAGFAAMAKVQGEARVEEVLHIPDEQLAVPTD